MLILYGDGETLEKTYYTICNKNIQIYNLRNELVRETTVGYNIQKELRKVNSKYMLSNTIDPYCSGYDPSLGLIDMTIFFDPEKHSTKTAYYDNSRIGFAVNYGIVPVIATKDGFVLKNFNDFEKEYPILPYENVDNFDFEPKTNEQFWDEINTALKILNPKLEISDNVKHSVEEQFANYNNEVICVPADMLLPPEEAK